MFLRANPEGQKYLTKVEKKHGKGKALSILAQRLGRAVYHLRTRKQAFEMQTFLAAYRSRSIDHGFQPHRTIGIRDLCVLG